MKAIVLHAYGPPGELRHEEVADLVPQAGQVLVRVRATSVNPVDWMLRSGAVRSFLPITFPYILGLDLAGTIEATGERVMACGKHTYAELCVARENDLVRIPDGLSFEAAATLPLVSFVGDQLVHRGAKVAKGETVLVTGALGGVGRAAVFAAVESGAQVFAGVRGARLDEARALPGITGAVALDDTAALAALPALDAVADTVGRGVLAPVLAGRIRSGGRYGCFLAARAAVGELPGIEVNAINGNPDPATIARFAEAMAAGRFAMPIARTFSFRDASEAHRLAEHGAGGKVVLTP